MFYRANYWREWMKKLIPIMISIFYLVSCGGESPGGNGEPLSNLEKALLENTSWPTERVGVLDIVEAGGFDEEVDHYTCPNGKELKRHHRAFRTGCGPGSRKNSCLSAYPTPAQTGRDAVWAYETYSEGGSVETAWANGRPGRVPADCDGTKSQTDGQIPRDRSACST
jgi:hypothetical protein